jgi:hypothetical protein
MQRQREMGREEEPLFLALFLLRWRVTWTCLEADDFESYLLSKSESEKKIMILLQNNFLSLLDHVYNL